MVPTASPMPWGLAALACATRNGTAPADDDFRGVAPRNLTPPASGYQLQLWPLFCSASHFESGAK